MKIMNKHFKKAIKKEKSIKTKAIMTILYFSNRNYYNGFFEAMEQTFGDNFTITLEKKR